MPIIGYKKKFKNIKGLQNDIFIVNFNLEYNSYGFWKSEMRIISISMLENLIYY